MSDDLTPVDEALTPTTPDPSALTAEIEALRRKNSELLTEKKRLAKAERTLAELPEGTDVRELLSFKQQTEQQKLEAEGNYQQARQQLEQQFRDREASLQARVDALEAEVKDLRIIGPAVAALADTVHDPDEVIKLKLKPEQIDREPDGSLVVVDGYQRVPILDWAKTTLPQYRLKAPKPSGSGAPVGRSGGGDIPAGITNPFAPESFNLTEQARLFRTDPELYQKLKAA
ncbi:MAG: hypothetical protein EBR30_29455, partial [Cytophagia bacterium]|nr:hypothetical protein [Cytophagia bacterium]